ncbi:DDE-type integrase/transposase/recombinase [Sulfurospirillum cavolei]|uniref:DDE-type integrase/transposase/recombinase n=1 Tax=Sulfurospirillum cavolei TaxID=366522 RepID=UPI0006942A15|nr:DDE-type integrase/transposase/recombinase [Sulfurospirillum cavolei]
MVSKPSPTSSAKHGAHKHNLSKTKDIYTISPKTELSLKYLRATPEEQKEALAKINLVTSYLARERGVSFEEWANGKELPSRQNFFRWVKAYKEGLKVGNVVDNFIDSRGRPKGSIVMDAEMQAMCERYLLRGDIHPNNRGIYENMRVAFGDALPSFSSVERFIMNFKKENAMLMAFAKNPDKAKGKYRAAFGNASAKAKYKNHYWELDGTPADIICADGKRPTIVGAIDVFTRRVILNVEERSNSYALARNLRAGILKLGIPDNVVVDNGRDYRSNHFEAVCSNLHINKIEVEPYSGWLKPHIERFFGTMTRELFRQLEGFCGHSVAERQSIQDRLSFEKKIEARNRWRAQKLNEKAFRRLMLDKKNTMEVFIPITIDELRYWLQAWNEAVYEQRVHGGIGMSPMQRYISDITPAQTVTDPRKLDVLLGEWIEITVGKKGISLRRDGKEAIYTHANLIEHIGERVLVALGEDMGEAYIYNADMTPICAAKDASLEGISREAMRTIQRDMRRLESENTKRVKKAEALAQRLADPTIKDVIEQKAREMIVSPLSNIKYPTKNIAIDLPKETKKEPTTINGRPIFKSDFEALVWAIEEGKEAEFSLLISERKDIYEMALKDVEYRRTKRVG